jgi:hypothetical protein
MELDIPTVVALVIGIIILVYILLPSNVKSINVGRGSLVLFHRPSCPACVGFKPTWHDIQKYGNCRTIEFNTENPETELVITRYNLSVQGVPTLYKVNADFTRWEKFEGQRQYNIIKNWAERS